MNLFGWFRRNNKGGRAGHMQESALDHREVELPGIGRIQVARTLDCMGDGCPKPQILTLKALNQVPAGLVVELVSDNPTAVETIPAMMDAAYGQHLATIREVGYWRVYVRKGDWR